MSWRRGALAVRLLAGLLLLIATAWGATALYFLTPGPAWRRPLAAGAFGFIGLAALAGVWVRRQRRMAALGYTGAYALVLMLWYSATPSNDRDWQPEVAVLPYATFDGDRVTIHNVRNFDYRTETDFTPAYDDRTYDLRRLDRIDLVAVYWMGPAIAHLFVSFGFGDEHLAVSIEARKARGRPYATLPGFFRQYELVYVVGDERDVIRLRTNYRTDPPEEVYLYRLTGPIANGRRVFLDYLRDINALRSRPRFYNTLTTNCTTMLLTHAAVNPGAVPYSWKVLLSGYAPEYAYEQGRLDQRLPFAELRERSHINALARAADQAPDFSRRIRAGLP